MNSLIWIFFVLSLLGLFFVSMSLSSLRRLSKREAKRIFKSVQSPFIYRTLFLRLFPKRDYEGVFLSLILAQNFLRFIVIGCLIAAIIYLEAYFLALPMIVLLFLLLAIVFSFTDLFPRILGSRYPDKLLPAALLISTPFLLFFLPVIFIFALLAEMRGERFYSDLMNEPAHDVKHEIYQILEEAEIQPKLSLHDRKLIESVFRFQTRIAREIMVPRIDIFALTAEIPISKAAKALEDEGYSRVPVYKGTIDQIMGVVMYKDILTKYMEYQEKNNDTKILDAPIGTIVKNVMYIPETKKISNLLQEFRKRQSHIAIVVDEYGGTAGIVTIEDILEEIVGQIEDEYDEEAALFTPLHEGAWIVDGRMSLIDIEQTLEIEIPQEGDYDTIGGYIFHRAGTIPSKGFTIKLDEAELEVLKSNDRRVEKVKIKKIKPKEEKQEDV